MALLGTFIDVRTLAAITVADNATYAHGLGVAPDLVYVHENTTTNSTTSVKLVAVADATNVTVYNHGEGDSATLDAVAIYFHSIAR